MSYGNHRVTNTLESTLALPGAYGLRRIPDHHVLVATFADPDGNYFQLMSPMPAEVPA
jgi:hypothetical protein